MPLTVPSDKALCHQNTNRHWPRNLKSQPNLPHTAPQSRSRIQTKRNQILKFQCIKIMIDSIIKRSECAGGHRSHVSAGGELGAGALSHHRSLHAYQGFVGPTKRGCVTRDPWLILCCYCWL